MKKNEIKQYTVVAADTGYDYYEYGLGKWGGFDTFEEAVKAVDDHIESDEELGEGPFQYAVYDRVAKMQLYVKGGNN